MPSRPMEHMTENVISVIEVVMPQRQSYVNSCVQSYLRPTPIELKFENISLDKITLILDTPDYDRSSSDLLHGKRVIVAIENPGP